jgi:hypothetical protein
MGLEFVAIASESADRNIVKATEVPADADIVVVAGPRQSWPEHALKALREYLDKRQGKLVVLFDVYLTADGKMVKTGLEDLVAQYNVKVGDERLLQYYVNRDFANLAANPEDIPAKPPAPRDPKDSSLLAQLYRAFANSYLMLNRARPVGPNPEPKGEVRFVPAVLLEVPSTFHWAEPDLKTDARLLVSRTPQEEIAKKSGTRQTVAMVVSEVHPRRQGAEEKEPTPRMAIFGDASFIGNAALSPQNATAGLSVGMFQSTLGWLRASKPAIGIPPKKNDIFIMRRDTPLSKVFFLPGLLALVGIGGLGLGVWVVRRR